MCTDRQEIHLLVEAYGSSGHLRQLVGQLLTLQQADRLFPVTWTCNNKHPSEFFLYGPWRCTEIYRTLNCAAEIVLRRADAPEYKWCLKRVGLPLWGAWGYLPVWRWWSVSDRGEEEPAGRSEEDSAPTDRSDGKKDRNQSTLFTIWSLDIQHFQFIN